MLQDFIENILADPAISPALKEEAVALRKKFNSEKKRQEFIISRLSEDKKITENFLNKTVAELEERNRELSNSVRERQIAYDKLTEINKELEQFAYIISHDLQEPIRTILNFVSLLERTKRAQLDDEAVVYMDFISQSSHRMSNLIKAILDYSRIGKTGKKTTIDCHDLLREVLVDLDTIIEEKDAYVNIHPLPVVHGYRNELRSLFQNLLSNALKYSKKDVTPEITIDCIEKNQSWQFSVKDNGIGFDPRFRERIFIIFQRLNNAAYMEGSGIGLSRCKKIIELHAGQIWAESLPEMGSTFFFTLPKT